MTNREQIYVCELCDYKCSKKTNYNRHLTTQKHRKMAEECRREIVDATPEEMNGCECGKVFTFRQSLLRHKKTCNYENKNEDKFKLTSSLLIEIIQQNQELKNMLIAERKEFEQEMVKMMEQNNQIIEHTGKIAENTNMMANQQIPKILDTYKQPKIKNINNTFNFNVFLNVHCKDALNLDEFIDRIEIQVSDVESVGKLGFVDGITRILTNHLKDVGIYKRPIHCTDVKRDILYVKDEDKWDRDEEHKKVKKAIAKIGQKNFQKMHSELDKDSLDIENPNYEKTLKLIRNCNGGPSLHKNDEQIIQNLSKYSNIHGVDNSAKFVL